MYNNVGCECRKPEIGIVNRAPPFPVYFAIRQCSPTEIRVTFNLFYEKDGAICFVDVSHPVGFDVGHDLYVNHRRLNAEEADLCYPLKSDWEGAVVIYSRDASSSVWTATNLLMSQHGGYLGRKWSDIRNTLS